MSARNASQQLGIGLLGALLAGGLLLATCAVPEGRTPPRGGTPGDAGEPAARPERPPAPAPGRSTLPGLGPSRTPGGVDRRGLPSRHES